VEIVLYFNSRKMSQTNRSRLMQNVYNYLPAYGYCQASVPFSLMTLSKIQQFLEFLKRKTGLTASSGFNVQEDHL
jgi:hypothetical protein